MRIDRIRNMEIAKRNRDRLRDPMSFPSTPKGDVWWDVRGHIFRFLWFFLQSPFWTGSGRPAPLFSNATLPISKWYSTIRWSKVLKTLMWVTLILCMTLMEFYISPKPGLSSREEEHRRTAKSCLVPRFVTPYFYSGFLCFPWLCWFCRPFCWILQSAIFPHYDLGGTNGWEHSLRWA